MQLSGANDAWGSLAAFLLGYVALLAIPGPNMFAVSVVASTEGLKRCLPLCFGLMLGATASLAAILLIIVDAAPTPAAKTMLSWAGAFGLCLQALSLFRQPKRKSVTTRFYPSTPNSLHLLSGVIIGATNPLSCAYFATMIAASGELSAKIATPWLFGVASLAFLRNFLIAAFFARLVGKMRTHGPSKFFRRVAAVTLIAFAFYGVWPAGPPATAPVNAQSVENDAPAI